MNQNYMKHDTPKVKFEGRMKNIKNVIPPGPKIKFASDPRILHIYKHMLVPAGTFWYLHAPLSNILYTLKATKKPMPHRP
jgi:hypothetical protein